ncbi:MAG: hypothetical protein QMD09_08045 [Desulfatibacillaceae bacterium]|nr:hypothetical protein [Desulfatibacillaceae bacterium]
MQYQYRIKRDDEKKLFVISEFAYNSEDSRTLIGEFTFKPGELDEAVKQGEEGVARILRSSRFYPPAETIRAIAGQIIALYNQPPEQGDEALVDEMGAAASSVKPQSIKADAEDDKILDDDDDDTLIDDAIDDDDEGLKLDDDDLSPLDDEDEDIEE